MKKLNLMQVINRISMACKGAHVADVIHGCIRVITASLEQTPERIVWKMTAKTLRELADQLEEKVDASSQLH